jgi:hypothetical protein
MTTEYPITTHTCISKPSEMGQQPNASSGDCHEVMEMNLRRSFP